MASQFFSITLHSLGEEKNIQKELGMNSGPLAQQGTALTTRPNMAPQAKMIYSGSLIILIRSF